MGEYHIQGGNRLSGEVAIGGGKNAILPILASVILNSGESVIQNCPRISDTFISIEILKSMGCSVNFTGNTLTVNSSTANLCDIPENLVREMRSSIIFLGGILGRFKKCKISYPGGCELGARPIDLHLKALRELGIKVVEEHGFISCEANEIVGAKINLDFPSVGATENIMLASVMAKGETVITNPAREPEIVDLQIFLNSMGAKIKGGGTDKIIIQGVEKLNDAHHNVMPDRIVAGTYLVAGAITNGEVLLTDVNCQDLTPITSKLLEVGCYIKEYSKDNKIFIKAPKNILPIERLRTMPHPGFPTDMQSQFMTLLARAKGTSIFVETLFESRNKHISELSRMGANILLTQDGMTSIIKGVDSFSGAVVEAKELRGGAALILAGLCADGETIVKNSKYVERGYESIERDISSIGGNIKLIKNI